MGEGLRLGWYKFRVGCKGFVFISSLTYLLLLGLAEAVMHPIPPSLSVIYWVLLIPTIPIGIWGAFIAVDWHERLLVGQYLGYSGHRGGHRGHQHKHP